MFEDAIERSGFTWQFIHDYQPFMVGLLALGAAVLTALYLRKQIKASVEEGKRERAFRMKQHEIEMQTKRRAAAVMLAAEIRSVVKTTGLEGLAENARQYAEKFEQLDDDERSMRHLFAPAYELFLNNYSNYTENMPLMRVDTVQEVSRSYSYAANLSKRIEFSNATMEEKDTNKTRANFLTSVSYAAESTKTQFEKTLPLLEQEAEEAQKELNRLEGA